MKELPEAKIYVKEEGKPLIINKETDDVNEAIDAIGEYLFKLDREAKVILSLDKQIKPINYNIVSFGDEDSVAFSLKNIFKPAILNNAAYIITFHNHPSEDKPKPSNNDIINTCHILAEGYMLGIGLLDDIIIGKKGNYQYTSKKLREMEKYIIKKREFIDNDFLKKFKDI